jgi:hypothetical protein
MWHDQVLPIAGCVAAPAVFWGDIFQCFAMSHFDFVPERFITVGMGRFMATITIHFIFRRMSKARHIPGLYRVAFSAFIAKEPAVNIGMTAGAWKFPAEQGVIYL